jgi:translocator protein
MSLHYFIIPILIFLVAYGGSSFTSGGMDWYKSINLPTWVPPGSVIGLVWTTIFILAAISLIVLWNKGTHNTYFWTIIGVCVVNGLLNIAWSYLFFGVHYLGWAVIEAALLDLSVIALIFMMWPISQLSALLLVPYAGWVAFATYLTYVVYSLNH